jgi:hypothetical protein
VTGNSANEALFFEVVDADLVDAGGCGGFCAAAPKDRQSSAVSHGRCIGL